MSLIGSLGLDAVESDPNALPDGKWAGEIFKSEYVYHKAKNAPKDAPKDHVSHVITYRVTEGERKGSERQEWYPICRVDEVDANNQPVKTTPTMPEQQKSWYKKRLEDLGVAPEAISTLTPESLVGKKVTFGTKKNGAYINISFVELREAPEATTSTGSILGSL